MGGPPARRKDDAMPLLLIVIAGLGLVAFGLHGAGQAAGGAIVPAPPGVQQTRLSPGGAEVSEAAQLAFATEMFPSRLRAFAATLMPDFPGEATMLQGKAAAIDNGMMPGFAGQ